jgi:hypothetical protein
VRALAYLASGALVLPLVLLALYFQLVGELIAAESLPRLLLRLLDGFLAIPWVVVGSLGVLAAWSILAVVPSYRYLGARATMLAAILALVRVFVGAGRPRDAGELVLPLLAAAGLAVAAWLSVSEGPE